MTGTGAAVRRLLWAFLFAVAFAFVESAVVIYLRSLYYPGGFAFPLHLLSPEHVTIELIRELATVIMIASVAVLAGTGVWSRFGYFIFIFGVWDIFFYFWLKVAINWPATMLDWDILFLIPLPWIGPVIAPALVALVLAICGAVFVLREARGQQLRLTLVSVILFVLGTAVILFSFLADTGATLRGEMPLPYHYELLVIGLVLYLAAFAAIRRHEAAPPARQE